MNKLFLEKNSHNYLLYILMEFINFGKALNSVKHYQEVNKIMNTSSSTVKYMQRAISIILNIESKKLTPQNVYN